MRALLLRIATCLVVALGTANASELKRDPTVPIVKWYVSQWQEFCDRYPGECAAQESGGTSDSQQRLVLTAKLMRLLDRVNKQVNTTIRYIPDVEHWRGMPCLQYPNCRLIDRWDLPTATQSSGDCEDYALQKRHDLIRLGIPHQAIVLAVVTAEDDKDLNDHIVLLVRTDRGEMVLDNRSSSIVAATAIPYKKSELQLADRRRYQFLERQVYGNELSWISLFVPDDFGDDWDEVVSVK